ncbi:hypothetical protein F0323_015855 [Enterobacter hormaechei]|uniref:hypothetical protein n=1 Tax=Enterobacter hormaechei TaxID=158836 RepID=UPI0011F33669|nr:hypothetical protein [Enterobacter hormaechei]KAA0592101.1 hypothetical protein F0323_04045 [Enterobacter hormaechei]
MECKVSDLVKRAHDQVAELKASWGAVDVRDVAQLISDLATQLDVQLARSNALAAENAGLKDAIEKHADSYIMCGYCRTERDGKNDDVCEVLDSIPATDAFLAEVRALSRNKGINYAASRLAAALSHGFVDKPLAEVYEVVHMIMKTKEDLENDPTPAADGLSGEYAEKFLAEFAAQIRKGVQS